MRIVVVLCLIFVCSSIAVAQQNVTGQVVGVVDGSTVIIATSANYKFSVRLQFIDPPERGQDQALHDLVNNHLRSLTKDKTVTAQLRSVSQGLWTGRVLLNGVDLSMQMLRDGAAWYSVPEAEAQDKTERTDYLDVERKAKEEKRGV